MKFDLRALLNKPITLKRTKSFRVRTRPTRAGWGFGVLILCVFLLSVNFSNNLIFAMTFLLVAVALVGWLHTRVNVSGLVLSEWQCDPVFAGQTVVYRLTAENRKKQTRIGLRTSSDTKSGLVGSSLTEVNLAGNRQAEMRLLINTTGRGRLKAMPADIRSCFPLGIFEACLTTAPMPDCPVYPAPMGEQPLADRQSQQYAHLASEAGTYQDTRRYAPGDPLSRIDWKALARFDELYTREFDGARGEAALRINWDDVRVDGTEEKLSQLCLWVLTAHKGNREYGLEIPQVSIKPAIGETHLRECLEALAFYSENA